jgi:hypothetical protein
LGIFLFLSSSCALFHSPTCSALSLRHLRHLVSTCSTTAATTPLAHHRYAAHLPLPLCHTAIIATTPHAVPPWPHSHPEPGPLLSYRQRLFSLFFVFILFSK